MDQLNPWDNDTSGSINTNYVVCPVCGFWYDKTHDHICLNISPGKDRTLEEILNVLKRIENILERKL